MLQLTTFTLKYESNCPHEQPKQLTTPKTPPGHCPLFTNRPQTTPGAVSPRTTPVPSCCAPGPRCAESPASAPAASARPSAAATGPVLRESRCGPGGACRRRVLHPSRQPAQQRLRALPPRARRLDGHRHEFQQICRDSGPMLFAFCLFGRPRRK